MRISSDFAQVLIHVARKLCGDEQFSIELDETIFQMDQTTSVHQSFLWNV